MGNIPLTECYMNLRSALIIGVPSRFPIRACAKRRETVAGCTSKRRAPSAAVLLPLETILNDFILLLWSEFRTAAADAPSPCVGPNRRFGKRPHQNQHGYEILCQTSSDLVITQVLHACQNVCIPASGSRLRKRQSRSILLIMRQCIICRGLFPVSLLSPSTSPSWQRNTGGRKGSG